MAVMAVAEPAIPADEGAIRRRGGRKGLSREAVAEAIEAASGILSAAARSLGCTRQALSARVRADAGLLELAAAAREALVDEAETQVLKAVQAGDLRTSRWVCARLGGNRGWGEGAPPAHPEPLPPAGLQRGYADAPATLEVAEDGSITTLKGAEAAVLAEADRRRALRLAAATGAGPLDELAYQPAEPEDDGDGES